MPKLTFTHGTLLNTTLEAKAGNSILETAIDHDVPLQHACGGYCACTTCHIHVKAGMEHLSPMEEDEIERLASVDQKSEFSRLSCQTKLIHPDAHVSVEIINLD